MQPTYTHAVVIVEFKAFTRAIKQLMDDDQYRELQEVLVKDPELGDLIKGTHGLRKVRWRLPGTGKRGGTRIIYYWWVSNDQLLMLLAYPKNKQSDLTPEQKAVLSELVKRELGDG